MTFEPPGQLIVQKTMGHGKSPHNRSHVRHPQEQDVKAEQARRLNKASAQNMNKHSLSCILMLKTPKRRHRR